MMRRVALAVAGLLALAVVVGCTPQPVPSPTPEPDPSRVPWVMPDIVGETVSDSPLESDEWVIAARASELGVVLASNAADFSIEPLRSTLTADSAREQFRHFISRSTGDDLPLTWPGPAILLPLEVEVRDAVHVTVRFCDGSDYWIDEDASRLARGVLGTVSLERTADGIRRTSRSTSRDRCDATGAPIARFDPAPVPLGPLTEDDVVPPPPVADDGRGS
jgi:hypothetical protein